MFAWGDDTASGFKPAAKTSRPSPTHRENGVTFVGDRFDVEQVSAGGDAVAYTRSDGMAFIFPITENPAGERVAGKRTNIRGKWKYQSVSCGGDATILLSKEGNVFCLGKGYCPSPLTPLNNIVITQVACGSQHSLALAKDGRVYAWGKGSSGQLGLGKAAADVVEARHLGGLSSVPLVQIAAGGDQSFALSFSGAVIAWGGNSSGQLGLGDREDRHTPTVVHCLNLKKTIHISCGENHTALLTKDGTVLTFGSGQYGQLGHNSFGDELRPRVVTELLSLKVTEIVCGRCHTLVLTDSKKVYSFGRGGQGQLGRGEIVNQSIPLAVQLPQDTVGMGDSQIGHIFAGGSCSFAVCTLDQGAGEMSNNLFVRSETQGSLDNMIDNWIAEGQPKQWKQTIKEIKGLFSSAASLNLSFLDRSDDKHFQTSSECSGLKLSRVRRVFRKLEKSNRVMAKVEDVILHTLLPSLDEGPVAMEGLRVYLILTEFFCVLHKCKPQQSPQLAVATAMSKLQPDSLQILGNWWSSLKPSWIFEHVQLWKHAFSQHVLSMTAPFHDSQNTIFETLLQVLQHLHKANNIAGPKRIPDATFCLDQIDFSLIFLEENLDLWRLNKEGVNKKSLCHFPFVMNLRCKKNIFDINVQRRMAQHQQSTGFRVTGAFELRLKRAALVEDTFNQLGSADHRDFKKPLVVYFDEDPKLTNVYKHDFFLHLFHALMLPESGMFMYNDSKTLAWFPSQATLESRRYFLFGVLCGLALYNQNIIHLPFPMALFKKLVKVRTSLEDLMEFKPDVGKSLKCILEDYCDDDLQNIFFSAFWDGREVELDPLNPGKPVTSHNKEGFVDAYVNHAFNTSVERVFEVFRQGFFSVCDQDVVELFRPEELSRLMTGEENYDWNKLKQNTTYEGEYHANHPVILTFWEVFYELNTDQKKDFLLFLTGCARPPILGMDQIWMRIRVLYGPTEQLFPEALTCHFILDLPLYSTKKMLLTRLTEALSGKRGFRACNN